MTKQVDIVFMLDTSGSMSDEIDAVKQGCVDFADRIVREEAGAVVRLGLIGFDIGGHRGRSDGPYAVHQLSRYTIGVWPLAMPQEFKANISMLSLGLFGGGGCYLANTDSVDIFPHVVNAFDQSMASKRVLVIISDEVGSKAGLSAIVSRLTEASITAHVMGVAQNGKGAHEAIAQMTGGHFWNIAERRFNLADLLGEVAVTIGQEMRGRGFQFARPPFAGDAASAYRRPWNSLNPGCLIVLLDQSGSMNEPFGGSQVGSGRRKCDMVATVLNGLLADLVTTNTIGQQIKPRAEIAVLGYEGQAVRSALSGPLESQSFVGLPDLVANPLRIETRQRKEVDDSGAVMEAPIAFRVWVDAAVGTRTPMCAALDRAGELAEGWAVAHPDSYPPVVVNITDGASTDGVPSGIAAELRKIYTRHGQALLLNCYLTTRPVRPVEFPVEEREVAGDPDGIGALLFEMSSVIPDAARENIAAATGIRLRRGARGLILNADAGSVRQMFVFATVAAGPAMDRNR